MHDVLLFQRSKINHNSLNQWVEKIDEQLHRFGLRTHFINLVADQEEIAASPGKILQNNKIDAAIAVNSIGQHNWVNSGTGTNLWDSLDIPFINWIVDHPLEHYSDLSCTSKNYNVICVDQNHREFVNRYFPDVKSAFFLPLGGLGDIDTVSEGYDSFSEREFDVVLTAGLMEPTEIKRSFLSMPQDFREIVLGWTDYMEHNINLAPEEALKRVLKDKYGDIEVPDELYFNLAKIGNQAVFYIRTWIRKKIVKTIMDSGLKFHLFGSGWDELNSQSPDSGAILHGDIPIDETVSLMKRTKLAINIMPMFKAGTHDRIATAQINGAAVLTDTNDYIDRLYGDDEILKYRLDDIVSLPDRIKSIRDDMERLYSVAVNGQRKAKESLSWDSTGEQLYEILKIVIDK